MYKKSVVCCYIHILNRARTSWAHFLKGIDKAKNILKNNQYPLTLKFIETVTLNRLTFFDEKYSNNVGVDENKSEYRFHGICLDSNEFFESI